MTLAQAIEKVGVGGKVIYVGNSEPHIALDVGQEYAIVRLIDHKIQAILLSTEGWSPVLPKKRVVLQAWEYKPTGGIFWYEHAPKNALIEDYAHRTDIPNMVFEDGKWVFER